MINLILGAVMGLITNFITFIIVAGIFGILFLLPFAIKGGWVVYVMMFIFIICSKYTNQNDKKGKK